ncbi:uncharacterized protein Triagg1_10275 [Trichoderma aggressivum f. europaeum]|uniref:Uncharacterized protein n=1 Tax=Trichoderma aggressivum f. europaeum TaxID=173218 RepID=A0AAE1J0I0_9HYPO|nr:hypothetical protein Triagg1_10275 [Trichoderma aggressivum f. europaeum]
MLSSKRAPPASLEDVLVVGGPKSGIKSARFLGGGPSRYSKSSSFLTSVYRLLNLEPDTFEFEALGSHAVPFDGSDDPSSSLCTLPMWPFRNLTLMPRGWSPDSQPLAAASRVLLDPNLNISLPGLGLGPGVGFVQRVEADDCVVCSLPKKILVQAALKRVN